jgi:predicted ATPase
MRAPLIRRLTLQNFLSYGPHGVSVDLLPLNVLIGSNASGKSNLLESLAILRAASGDLSERVREGGGVGEILYKGGDLTGRIEIVLGYPESGSPHVIRHEVVFSAVGTSLVIKSELIELEEFSGNKYREHQVELYKFLGGSAVLHAGVEEGNPRKIIPRGLKVDQSILAQRRDPEQYPELTFVADHFAKIVLFQDWNFGRRSSARLPEPTDLPPDFLLPDASNLGLVLHELMQISSQRDELIAYLQRFYEPARGISTRIVGGTLQLYIEEEGRRLIPATRLSDGTLRYLCLLAILCHPSPPRVIGIEEPELGLHPDILPTVAELLRKASERTQLFVTTHSDALVSALSEVPESILISEATPAGTTMKRLEAEPLREWLEKYSLGEIWRMGEIGGNRW